MCLRRTIQYYYNIISNKRIIGGTTKGDSFKCFLDCYYIIPEQKHDIPFVRVVRRVQKWVVFLSCRVSLLQSKWFNVFGNGCTINLWNTNRRISAKRLKYLNAQSFFNFSIRTPLRNTFILSEIYLLFRLVATSVYDIYYYVSSCLEHRESRARGSW